MKKKKVQDNPFFSPNFDPNGSYTGNYQDSDELTTPIQDADDL